MTGDIVWSVTRRYRDFELLSKRLAQTFQKDRLPKLPPKRVSDSTNDPCVVRDDV